MEQVKTPWYSSYDGVRQHLEYPDYSIYQFLEEASKKRESLNAYNYFGKTATFKEFLEQIDSAARSFIAMGVKPKDIISVCMPNTPEALISFYAINKIGAVANMIHPLSAENEIKYYVNLTESKIIVTVDLALNKIIHILPETKLEKIIQVSVADSMPMPIIVGYFVKKGRKLHFEKCDINIKWSDFIKNGKQYTGETLYKPDKDDTAAILYSGGTSGFPKGIELTNLNFNALALQSVEICKTLHEGDRILSIMPVFHGFGLGICIHTALYLGATAVIQPQFNAAEFDKLLTKYKPNIIAGVPSLFEVMLKNKRMEGVDLSFLHLVISGGDSLSESLKLKVDKFLEEHGSDAKVREGYGLTECVTGSCLIPVNKYKAGSIGIPYPDTFYKVINPETLEEMPYGEDGEIVLSGPTVMKGYLNEPEETANTLRLHKDGKVWLHTGDLGYMDEDGFLFFKQRIKRMIISSGYNIYPQYLENIIDSVPEVLLSCVIGIDHPLKVQVAKAFIVLREGYEPTDEIRQKIRDVCEKNLAKYSWPFEYEFRKELPKTLVGKVAFTQLIEEEKAKSANKE
ncbi:MAG: AMP-binding protein [Lachnospiraceae bacterium]|nr:AMP-binding protein [Lachnospiraceae bacterium]